MGWKAFKDHFKITHIVHIDSDGQLVIGSPMMPKIVIIDFKSGQILKDGIGSSFLKKHYPEILTVDSEKIKELLAQEDNFSSNIKKVFRFKNGVIEEKLTEETNFPNVTHDGTLIYDNELFNNYSEALEKAVVNEKSSLSFLENDIKRLEKELLKTKLRLKESKNSLKNLENLKYQNNDKS